MDEDSESQDARSSKTSVTHHSASSKQEIVITREKRIKNAAFQTFLESKPDAATLESPPRRNLWSSQMEEERVQPSNACPICREYMTSSARVCEFCREVVCLGHFRKRRRNSTNKWTRICEPCEDRHLMEKHFQNEVKTEESLLTQEAILQAKHQELQQAIQQRKKRLEEIANKKRDAAERHRVEMGKLAALDKELDTKFKLIHSMTRENSNLQFSLMSMEQKLPPSLQEDFQFLQSENTRITKDLVKYDRMCMDAVKARSQREKDMYREYYQWEERKRREMEAAQKREGCGIY